MRKMKPPLVRVTIKNVSDKNSDGKRFFYPIYILKVDGCEIDRYSMIPSIREISQSLIKFLDTEVTK